jgi:hypothetical protein
MLNIIAHIFRYPITIEQLRMLQETDLSNQLDFIMRGQGIDWSDWSWGDEFIEFRSTNKEAAIIDAQINKMFSKVVGIVTFNTGRNYSKYGQRIACKLIDGIIYFVDIDRGIDGQFVAETTTIEGDPVRIQRATMAGYDAGSYDYFPNCSLKQELLSAAALVNPK